MKNLIFCIIIVSFLNSCTRYVPLVVQSPNLINTGLVTKKGSVAVSANYYLNSRKYYEDKVKINGLNLDTRVAISNHFFVEGTFATSKEFAAQSLINSNTDDSFFLETEQVTSERNYKIKHHSFGVGYIGKLNNEIFLLISLGKGKSSYKTDLKIIGAINSPSGIFDINFDNHRFYSNVGFYYKKENLSVCLGSQFSTLRYNNIFGNLNNITTEDINSLKIIEQNKPFLFQPFVRVGISPGLKNTFINFYSGFTIQSHIPENVRIRKLTIGVGLSWELGGLR